MKLTLKIKSFEELTTDELYEILKARSEVFMLGQHIICQDMDGVDKTATHVFYQDEKGEVQAYLRMFPKADEEDTIQIGRVLTRKPLRGLGLGVKLMEDAMDYAADEMGRPKAFVHSQEYAAGFYEKLGFKVSSEPFMEEGVSHVEMRREPE